MTNDDIIRMTQEAGFHAWYSDPNHEYHFNCVQKFAELVATAERERIAAEFDRRAVYHDGTPSSGWYEADEPAEIIRDLK